MNAISKFICRNPVLIAGLIVEVGYITQASMEEGLSSGEVLIAVLIGAAAFVQRSLVTPVSNPRLPVAAEVERY